MATNTVAASVSDKSSAEDAVVPPQLSFADVLKKGLGVSGTSFAEALKNGSIRSYGQGVKLSFPPLPFSDLPVPVSIETRTDGTHIIVDPEVESQLAKPLSWVLRGSFRGRRKSIAAIDQAITSFNHLKSTIQVSPLNDSDVLIRCVEHRDAIYLLGKHSVQVEKSQMRLHRWTASASYNPHLLALWCSLYSLPPHLASLPALESFLRPWGTVLAVADDAKFLTRPEVVRVCLEIDVSRAPPDCFYLHCLAGELKVKVTLDRFPLICNYCKLLGHEAECCRAYTRRRKKIIPRKVETKNQNSPPDKKMEAAEVPIFQPSIPVWRRRTSGKPPTSSLAKLPRPKGVELSSNLAQNKIDGRNPFSQSECEKKTLLQSTDFMQNKARVISAKPILDIQNQKQATMMSGGNSGCEIESAEEVETQLKDTVGNPLTCITCRKHGYGFCCCPWRRNEQPSERVLLGQQTNSTPLQTKGRGNSFQSKDAVKGGQESGKNVDGSPPAGQKSRGEDKASCSSKVEEKSVRTPQTSEAEAAGNGETENFSYGKNADSEMNSNPASSNSCKGDDCCEEPPSPAAPCDQFSKDKPPLGPMLWSSLAGDIHLNFEMCNNRKLEAALKGEIFDDMSWYSKKSYNKPLLDRRLDKHDPKFQCNKCNFALVKTKTSLCKLCAFQEPRKGCGRTEACLPPTYVSKSQECFFNHDNPEEDEASDKKHLLKRAGVDLQPYKEAAIKAKTFPQTLPQSPNKQRGKSSTKWGEMASDEEYTSKFTKPQPGTSGKKKNGKKIKSRLQKEDILIDRRTRSGKEYNLQDDGKIEKVIDGIRLLKVTHFDSRRNTTWQKWEVAPNVVITREKKRKLEDRAQNGEGL